MIKQQNLLWILFLSQWSFAPESSDDPDENIMFMVSEVLKEFRDGIVIEDKSTEKYNLYRESYAQGKDCVAKFSYSVHNPESKKVVEVFSRYFWSSHEDFRQMPIFHLKQSRYSNFSDLFFDALSLMLGCYVVCLEIKKTQDGFKALRAMHSRYLIRCYDIVGQEIMSLYAPESLLKFNKLSNNQWEKLPERDRAKFRDFSREVEDAFGISKFIIRNKAKAGLFIEDRTREVTIQLRRAVSGGTVTNQNTGRIVESITFPGDSGLPFIKSTVAKSLSCSYAQIKLLHSKENRQINQEDVSELIETGDPLCVHVVPV